MTIPEHIRKEFTVDDLAQEIRRIDGNHDKGAGALAEALFPLFLAAEQRGMERAAEICEAEEKSGGWQNTRAGLHFAAAIRKAREERG